MSGLRYELTAAQAAFLEAARRPSSSCRGDRSLAQVPDPLPPISDQAVRGTCVANAVASLVAYYEGCRRRVSVQYLDEVTRLVEQDWVTRNLKRVSDGEQVERDFEASFPEAVSQAMLLVKANGIGSDAANAFVRSLGTKIRARVEADAGCRLKRCFEALEKYGACREELWPYSPVALNVGASGGDAVGSFPPGTHEDARRHRIVNGLYVLRAPNNVDEIRGILAGAQGRRPMPVCVGLELFEGRTGGAFELPSVVREGDRAFAAERSLGIHEVLLIASADDADSPGGGCFTFQNSWGRSWGDQGTGRVSYAYVACFCREAGTILQEPGDYGPVPVARAKDEAFVAARRRLTIMCAVGICLVAAAASAVIAIWSVRKAAAPPRKMPAPSFESGPDFGRPSELVGYRYRMRGMCDSPEDVRKMVQVLRGRHMEFACMEIEGCEDGRYFEGEFAIEGLVGRPPHAIQAVEEFLKRKNVESAVRKWKVQRLQ